MAGGDPGTVTAPALRDWLESGQALTLLDVADGRSGDLFTKHEVLHIPLAELPDRLNELERRQDVVTICPFGVRSMKAAKMLTGSGFEHVFNLKGGLGAWEKLRPTSGYDGLVGRLYDLLDWPFERLVYRRWRAELLDDVRGDVLEPGVGTGHNLSFYHPTVHVTGLDLSPVMLRQARSKARRLPQSFDLQVEDATTMEGVPPDRFDWVFSTFMCCVMPDELQPAALAQFGRVLKPGGRFRLLEMVYSDDPKIARWQRRVSAVVERLYGARFDRRTLEHIEKEPTLEVTSTRFLKWQSYLVIDGLRTR